ncbi:MAG: hypothetical protein ACOZBW_07970 [Thermodesulfobacteriota bacterium]
MMTKTSKSLKPGFFDRLRKAFADYLKAVEKAQQNAPCKGG